MESKNAVMIDDEHSRSGRPRTHFEDLAKVTVVLYTRQVVFLDRLSADIRSSTGSVVKRAEILRALVDWLAEVPLDVSEIDGEHDIKTALRRVTRPALAAATD